MFQSTHPRGVRRSKGLGSVVGFGFNPRTRVGCDARSRRSRHFFPVSIHAPAWGATVENYICLPCLLFQSTHPRGVRLNKYHIQYISIVSIHAPAWGATYIVVVTDSRLPVFQSTHPRGVRPYYLLAVSSELGFNPRTRVGCDGFISIWTTWHVMVSIHAPAWGATFRVSSGS